MKNFLKTFYNEYYTVKNVFINTLITGFVLITRVSLLRGFYLNCFETNTIVTIVDETFINLFITRE